MHNGGARRKDGGFENSKSWGMPCPVMDDVRASVCNLKQPWGIIDSSQAGVPAAEGDKMACGNDMLNVTQRIAIKKGIPIKITFKARALPVLP